MVIPDNLTHEGGIVGIGIERTRKYGNSDLLGEFSSCIGHASSLVQDFKGVTEAHSVVLLDELDGVASFAARHAVKKSLPWGNDKVGALFVTVEGAEPFPIPGTMFGEGDAPTLHQGD